MSESANQRTNQAYSDDTGRHYYELFLKAHHCRAPEQDIWDECEDAYEGNAFRGEERDLLKKGDRQLLQVNKLKANADTLRSVLLANKPTIVTRPAGNDDEMVDNSAIVNDVIKHILYHSNFSASLSRNTTTAINTGLFWFEGWWDEYAAGGIGDIRVARVPVREVWLEPGGREADLEDHQRIYRSKRVPLSIIKQTYGERAKNVTSQTDEELEDLIARDSENYSDDYGLRDRHASEQEYKEEEYKEDGKARLITIYEKEYLREATPSTDSQGTTTVSKTPKLRIRKIVLAGFTVLENELMHPRFQMFPLVPAMISPRDDHAYPMGVTRFGVPIQREKDKIRMQLLSILNRQAKAAVLYEEGAIDPAKLREELSKPVAMIGVKAGVLKDKRVQILDPPQFPMALAEYERFADRDLDVVFNIYDAQRGESDDKRASGRKIALLQEQGRSNANDLIQSIELSLSLLGRLLVTMIQVHYTDERVLHITGDDGRTAETLKINASVPVVDQSGQPTGATVVVNDVRVGEYDVEVTAGSAMPSNRVLQQQMRLEYHDRGIIDSQAVLEHSDLPDRHEILQRIQTMQSMATQVDQLTNEVTQQKALIEELTRELLGVELRELSSLGDVSALVKSLSAQINNPTPPQQQIGSTNNGQT